MKPIIPCPPILTHAQESISKLWASGDIMPELIWIAGPEHIWKAMFAVRKMQQIMLPYPMYQKKYRGNFLTIPEDLDELVRLTAKKLGVELYDYKSIIWGTPRSKGFFVTSLMHDAYTVLSRHLVCLPPKPPLPEMPRINCEILDI